MTAAGDGTHVLVFPYPAQGHMIPLLDLTHLLASRGLNITILVTPKNLSLLAPLLSKHPTIKTLVLPFPAHPSIPSGVENVKDMPPNGFRAMMRAMGELYNPLLNWFHNHPSPPVAIISDMFLGWTHRLACQLSIRRLVFSPSGAMALSVVYSLWSDLPKRDDPNNGNALISFPNIPMNRGFVVTGWAPQVLILNHRAVGAFLTHCGWNSVIEGIFAGVPMLAWPMGADQFTNATLLVDELRVATRVCEGAEAIPNSDELARSLAEAVGENRVEMSRAKELREAALKAIKEEGGTSSMDLDDSISRISEGY